MLAGENVEEQRGPGPGAVAAPKFVAVYSIVRDQVQRAAEVREDMRRR